MKYFIFLLVTTALILLFASSCTRINQWLGIPDDNVVEETAEYVIHSHTGISFDLTPSTPEHK